MAAWNPAGLWGRVVAGLVCDFGEVGADTRARGDCAVARGDGDAPGAHLDAGADLDAGPRGSAARDGDLHAQADQDAD